MTDGEYNRGIHHNSHLAVGVPGTVAGLHLAWSEHGSLPWRRLVEPAGTLARNMRTANWGANTPITIFPGIVIPRLFAPRVALARLTTPMRFRLTAAARLLTSCG